jgi:hypothetical protein
MKAAAGQAGGETKIENVQNERERVRVKERDPDSTDKDR